MVYYFDRTQVNGAVGIFTGDGNSTVYTGTEIHREPEKYRDLAKKFTLETDLHFWFGEESPEENFYTVPEIILTAYDRSGGYLAQWEDTWIYIDAGKNCYRLPENTVLLSMQKNWRDLLEPLDGIHIFSSRAEAETEFKIQDFPQNL